MGRIFQTSSHIRQVTLLLNGGTTNVNILSENNVLVITSITPTAYPSAHIHAI